MLGATVLNDVTITGGHTNAQGADGRAVRTQGAIHFENSTIAGNTISADASVGGTAKFANSIVFGNESTTGPYDEFSANGGTVFQGLNIIGESTCTDASDGVINTNAEDVFADTDTSGRDLQSQLVRIPLER